MTSDVDGVIVPDLIDGKTLTSPVDEVDAIAAPDIYDNLPSNSYTTHNTAAPRSRLQCKIAQVLSANGPAAATADDASTVHGCREDGHTDTPHQQNGHTHRATPVTAHLDEPPCTSTATTPHTTCNTNATQQHNSNAAHDETTTRQHTQDFQQQITALRDENTGLKQQVAFYEAKYLSEKTAKEMSEQKYYKLKKELDIQRRKNEIMKNQLEDTLERLHPSSCGGGCAIDDDTHSHNHLSHHPTSTDQERRPAFLSDERSKSRWPCSTCTYVNPKHVSICQLCGTPK